MPIMPFRPVTNFDCSLMTIIAISQTNKSQSDVYIFPQNDPGTDAEILGNGAIVAYTVISSVLLISYVIDGRWEIQRFFLEWFWNFVGFVLFAGVGIVSAITWTAAQGDDSGNSTGEKARNYDAALTMSAFCILNSIVYFIDFIFAKRARNMYLAEEAGRW